MEPKVYTEKEMEAALCIWENMLKAHDALRDGCADLGFDFRERFWLSYDWDFTPAWLESGIDWETLSTKPVLEVTKAML